MSYDEEGGVEEQSFRLEDDDEIEPLEGMEDFGLEEEDPDKDH